MNSSWEARSFDSLAILYRASVRPEQAAGLPYIGLEHIEEGSLHLSGIGVAEDARSLKCRYQDGDILFGKLRPYFRKIVRAKSAGICSTDIWVVRPAPGIDRDYLFYLMASEGFLEPIVRASEGTRMPRAKWEYASSLVFSVPPLAQQQRIASILTSLDDKIELNDRLSATLDDLAQALFRKWFVEPAGDAWPSGGAELPPDWKAERLLRHVEATRGLSYAGSGLTESNTGLALHNLNSIAAGGGYKHSGIKWYSGSHKPRHAVRPGDLVVANTDLTQDALVIGSPALVPARFGDMGLFSHHLFRIDIRAESPLTATYLYWLFREAKMHSVLIGFTNGTTVNMLPVDGLSIPEIVIPPTLLLDRFTSTVAPMQERIEQIELENETLRQLRDTLLSPLLDGRIEVPLGNVEAQS